MSFKENVSLFVFCHSICKSFDSCHYRVQPLDRKEINNTYKKSKLFSLIESYDCYDPKGKMYSILEGHEALCKTDIRGFMRASKSRIGNAKNT